MSSRPSSRQQNAASRQQNAARSSGNGRGQPKASPARSKSSGRSVIAKPKARRRPEQSLDRPLVRRRGFWLALASIGVVLVLGGLALNSAFGNPAFQQNVAGVTSSQAPWAANPAGLQTRLAKDGLPALTSEGTTLHIHQHLDLYVNGQHLAIPADIGIDQASGILSPIHTHDTTGVIHVESPTEGPFRLGQFFDVWGVTLTDQCVGTYCAGNGNQLEVWVNGSQYSGDPSQLTLAAHQEIAIAFGTPSQMPSPIPTTYDWNGL